MGTITTRERKDGTVGHTAQIRLKVGGKTVHTESKTFDRAPAAAAWLKKREAELAQPGGVATAKARANDPTLADVIDTYIKSTKRNMGRTKLQALARIKRAELGGMRCSEIDSPAIVRFAQELSVQPQTVGNYLSHLAAVVRLARPAWGYPLEAQTMSDARLVAERMGLTGRSKQRDRRPTLDELDRLLAWYKRQEARLSEPMPMADMILFAIFSTRRQEEITTIVYEDLRADTCEMWVRDMKHPGEKIGNDALLALTPEALAIIQARHKAGAAGLIFPCVSKSVSSSFTRACKILGIKDLHFHDLRHDGISRLFEMGWSIPRVATVSGHRTWTSLKRYTHIRQVGDKYEDWTWRPGVGADDKNHPRK